MIFLSLILNQVRRMINNEILMEYILGKLKSCGRFRAGWIQSALVISEEAVNQALPIVTILSLTTYRPGRTIYPTEFLLKPVDSNLNHTSILMAHQIRSISKAHLGKKCGQIESEECREKIKHIVKLYLDLP